MDRTQITSVLDQMPAELLATSRFVHHSFFGPEAKLRRVRTAIKRRYSDAFFEMGQGDLAVTTVEVLTPDALFAAVSKMQDDAQVIGIEYDGFEIGLDSVDDCTNFAPLEQSFKPGSYLRFALGNGRFGYMQFLGGTQKDGVLVDCFALTDDGQSDVAALAQSKRLYRQPVLGVIDPEQVELVGHSAVDISPVPFRVATEYPALEDVDALAAEHGFDVPLSAENWPALLDKLARSGTSLRRGDLYHCAASLTSKGRISWSETVPLDDMTAPLPMPFGAHVTVETLDQALCRGMDVITLNDQVM